jgi:hypothetical protein
MVDRHYSLNLKSCPWSARTLYVYAHADLAPKYSVGLHNTGRSISVIEKGVKKIPVVPVSYREKIRVGRSEIIFF